MNRLLAGFAIAQAIFVAALLVLRAGAPSPAAGGLLAPQDPSASWEPSVPVRPGWTHIIIHHSASATGSAAHFDRIHREKGWEGLGYHFVIGNGSMTENGRVEPGERWLEQRDGAHAKAEWNSRAVGICLVGNFEDTNPTPEQLASLEALCRWLMRRCGIPAENVLRHGETHGNQTLCPGKRLDVEGLRKRLGASR
ncbi:MAG: peptidoglycan recognition protein family protein [Planctomycetes bacterium]|nr:peptidoglycan recognition protein family protein [Planctomycetota bacterium]